MKNRKGFTLVEILLALAILGIGLVGLLSVFVVGGNSIRHTVEKTEASFIAQLVIEDLKRQGQTDPTSLSSPPLPQHYIDSGYSFEPDPPSSTLVQGNLYKVDITIKKKDKQIGTFTTYITQYVP